MRHYLIQANFKQQQTKLEGQEQKLHQLKILEKQLQLVFQTQQQQNQAQKLEKLAQVNQAKQNLDALKNTYDLQKEEKQEIIQPELDENKRYQILSDLFSEWLKEKFQQVDIAIRFGIVRKLGGGFNSVKSLQGYICRDIIPLCPSMFFLLTYHY